MGKSAPTPADSATGRLDAWRENVPEELKASPQWVAWRTQRRGPRGKPTKVPYQAVTVPAGEVRPKADPTGPSTWRTHTEAVAAYEACIGQINGSSLDGIGYVFAEDDGLVGIDYDLCLSDDGEVAAWAERHMGGLGVTYAEVSPSGRGVKAFYRGRLPDKEVGSTGRRRGGYGDDKLGVIECYDRGRYFTVTGDPFDDCRAINEADPAALAELVAELDVGSRGKPKGNAATAATVMTEVAPRKPTAVDQIPDEELLERARTWANGPKFSALFDRGDTSVYGGDQSRADLALLDMLAFTTGNDATRMERLFGQSALATRCKWTDRPDYRQRTIDRALNRDLSQVYDPQRGRLPSTSGKPPTGGGQRMPVAEKRYDGPKRTDTGNAQRLAMRHGWKIRYCTAKGCWYVYDGQRFKEDDTLAIMRLASDTVRCIGAEAAEIVDNDNNRRDMLRWALQSEARKSLDAMIYLARAAEGLQVSPMHLDVDPMLLNVRNGTVDLRTGELRPHSPEDLITKMAPVDYDPDARCPRFEQFEREIYQGDEALIGYMRRQLGYGLTGLNTVQEMLILHGNGSNGKNVLMDTIMSILGDYAAQADATLLVTTKSEPHPTGLAGLEGRRFVYASETEAGKRMAEGLVKTITGNRVLKARMMHKDFYEFPATFKLYLLTNHEPIIEGMDEGIWRRLLKVPFLTKFVKPGEPAAPPTRLPIEPGLIDYFLEHEAPGILALLVRGCMDWQAGGMRPPDSVLAATDQYRSKMDTFGSFVEERCMQDEAFQMSASELYQAYVSWASENGIKRVANLRDFGQDMERRGFKVKHTNRGNLRRGIALRAAEVPRSSSGVRTIADAEPETVDGSL